MAEKLLKKEIELREWQRMFNPAKAQEQGSVILKKQDKPADETQQERASAFSW